MLDPLIMLIIRVGFSLLFITAALQKLRDRDQFDSVLRAYELLPSGVVPVVAISLPVVELLLGLGWITMAGASPAIALMTALLLSIYTVSIGINLRRGRRHIDCGCGFRSSIGKSLASGNVQQLSHTLLLRNGVLIAIALIATNAVAPRQLGYLDLVFVLLASIAFILLYGGVNQLLANNDAIGAWRNSHG